MSGEEYDLAVNSFLTLTAAAYGLCGKPAHSDTCRCDHLEDDYQAHAAGCDACRAELRCPRGAELRRAIKASQPDLRRRLAVQAAHQQHCAACRDGKRCKVGGELRQALEQA